MLFSKEFKNAIENKIETDFLNVAINYIKDNIFEENVERMSHLTEVQRNYLHESFNTPEFEKYVSHEYEEMNDFFVNLKKYIEKPHLLNINTKGIKKYLSIATELVNINVDDVEKFNLYMQCKYKIEYELLHDNLLLNIPEFIIERMPQDTHEILKKTPNNLEDFFTLKKDLKNILDKNTFSANKIPYIDVLEKKLNRFFLEPKEKFIKTFENKYIIEPNDFADIHARNLFLNRRNELEAFLAPQYGKDKNVIKFFKKYIEDLLELNEVVNYFKDTKSELIYKIGSKLDDKEYASLAILYKACLLNKENNTKIDFEFEPIVKKLLDNNVTINFSDVKNNIGAMLSIQETFNNFFEKYNEEKYTLLQERLNKSVEDNENVFNISPSRVICFDISSFLKYFPEKHKKAYHKILDNLEFKTTNFSLTKMMNSSKRMVEISINGHELLSDNKIIKEIFNFIRDSNLLELNRNINNQDTLSNIISETMVYKYKEMILNEKLKTLDVNNSLKKQKIKI